VKRDEIAELFNKHFNYSEVKKHYDVKYLMMEIFTSEKFVIRNDDFFDFIVSLLELQNIDTFIRRRIRTAIKSLVKNKSDTIEFGFEDSEVWGVFSFKMEEKKIFTEDGIRVFIAAFEKYLIGQANFFYQDIPKKTINNIFNQNKYISKLRGKQDPTFDLKLIEAAQLEKLLDHYYEDMPGKLSIIADVAILSNLSHLTKEREKKYYRLIYEFAKPNELKKLKEILDKNLKNENEKRYNRWMKRKD